MKNILKTLKSIFRELASRPRHYKLPARVNYHENWLLPPLAVFVGIFIVLYGHHRSFGEAMLMLDFYKAAIPSILSGWVVMWCVVRLTYVLDEQQPWTLAWYRGPLTRVVLQLGGGVIMPGFFIFGVFALYFLARGHAERIIRYLLEDFPFVLLMFLGFNVLLWFYYRLRYREITEKYRKWRRDNNKPEEQKEEEPLPAVVEVIPYVKKVKDRIALIEPSKKSNNTAITTDFDGKREIAPQAMRDLYTQIAGYHYFQLRREMIANRKAIASMREEARIVIVTLAAPRIGEEIKVANRQREEFLVWWVMEEENE